MSYGLTVWDAQGRVQMTLDDFTYQVMHSQVYDLRTVSPIVVNIPGFDPAKCSAVILPIDAITEAAMGSALNALPYMALSAGSIGIYRQTPTGTATTGASSLRFRLLVMRYTN
ncbi:hypothetical protein [Pseudomonas fontis]|uniref:Uncharacterized protein n=1 Tax=Pseudomonas fontis TaxID=2942633 RepID=A0ABT5NRH5_9PSED|nr:hypothetical protein [Pseudomonas fontis]MDD0977556.1 hypothetical protein [Pseudomonas fontis]MDD0990758.1 hypothetical protein [Pseudomonas fontis]